VDLEVVGNYQITVTIDGTAWDGTTTDGQTSVKIH
jgi:uncharacterized protein YdeI (BOF family)